MCNDDERTGSGPFYHVGIVVADLQAGMAAWSTALGVTWGPVQSARIPTGFHDGPRDIDAAFVLSFEGPPYVELVMQSEATPWPTPGIHHVGTWSPDVGGQSHRLELAGCPWRSAIVDDQGHRVGGCYHEVTEGACVELVAEESKQRLRRYLDGGPYL